MAVVRTIGSIACAALLVAMTARPLSAQAVAYSTSLVTPGPRFLAPVESGARSGTGKWVDVSKATILQRTISVSLNDVPLGDALVLVARKGGLHLTYSPGVVRARKPVTLNASDITVGGALTALLYDAGVDVLLTTSGQAAVVRRITIEAATGTLTGHVTDAKTGQGLVSAQVSVQGTNLSAMTGDNGEFRIVEVPAGEQRVMARRVGYASSTRTVTVLADQEATVSFALDVAPTALDQVVVTGTVIPTSEKEIPTPITVIDSKQIQQRGITQMEQLFRGEVPGMVSSSTGTNGESSGLLLYIRGSANVDPNPYGNTIKTYIDGVEVTDPTFINNLDPKIIDRIEIVRGPEASTMYGSQAINGVMQIFTKKGTVGMSKPQVTASLAAGTIQGQYTDLMTDPLHPSGVTAQYDASVAVTGGGQQFSYAAGVGTQRTGAWEPNDQVRNWSYHGGARWEGGPLSVNASARFNDRRYTAPNDPFFAKHVLFGDFGYVPSGASFLTPYSIPTTRLQRTLGMTAQYTGTPWWHNTFTVGQDHMDVNMVQDRPRYRTPSDSLLQLDNTSAGRTSVAYNTSVDVPVSQRVRLTATAGADHWEYLSNETTLSGAASSTGSIPSRATTVTRVTDRNTGYFAQAKLGVADALFFTTGIRAEQSPDFGADYGLAYSPRFGVSYVQDIGALTVKLRASSGSAIKPPPPGAKDAQMLSPVNLQVANPLLGPARQTGQDGGIDVYWGRRASVSATYYNQIVNNLIGVVVLSQPGAPVSVDQNQNFGRAKNTGIELETNIQLLESLALHGTYSVANSHMVTLDRNYNPGSLTAYHPGDPLRNLPHSTGAWSLTYARSGTTVYVAGEYRGQAIVTDFGPYLGSAYSRLSPAFNQPGLFSLPASAKYQLRASQDILPGIRAFAQVNNVLNDYKQDFLGVRTSTGRTTLFGVQLY